MFIRFLRIPTARRGRCYPCKAIGDEEDEVDERSVCCAFDFEVSEQRIRPEEVQGFIYDIRLARVRCDPSKEGYVDIANVRMWDVIDHYTELTWGRRRTTYTGLQRQDSHVTDSIEVGAIVEARMVRLSNGSRIMTSTR